eukprot:TRINITY_DN24285_c0_g1_i1.p1 TRINITY_DN24285_c0_g1~~TRINITY_DN24285_c0_g1_i1.p1  ORF type:complete len:142 (-),score=35.23 TRINITY_DN24285_c0_g1_i1:61-486(-)
MGRYHPSLPDYDEGESSAQKSGAASGGLGYSLLEKFAIGGVLEASCVGALVLLARSGALARRKLSPAQTNLAIAGALGVAPFFIVVQKAYYDTLLEARGLRPQAGGGGLGSLNFSLLSPTRLTWDEAAVPANYSSKARWDT